MSEHSTDIEFDFFDEPLTEETAPGRRAFRRGNGRPPVRPPSGFTPLLRLVGLIAFAIAVVVLMVFWVQSCRSESKRDAYVAYMDAVRAVAADSEQVGGELNAALTTPGIGFDELRQKLNGLAQQQEQDALLARGLVPPGKLRLQHQQAVEALQFRVSGLRRLQDAFAQSANMQNPGEAGALLATQMRRLVASDVIWDDQFMAPAMEILRSEDIGGVEVPDSNFLSNPDLATERAMAPVWQRIQGAATGGTPTGLHGNALVSVRALPGGAVLSQDSENVVVATADLAFEVIVENSGESQEVRVKVLLTVDQSPRAIEKEQEIDLINPGERKTVVFRELGQIVQFQQRTTLKVEVEPVPGEQNLGNNSAEYPVTFSLTPP